MNNTMFPLNKMKREYIRCFKTITSCIKPYNFNYTRKNYISFFNKNKGLKNDKEENGQKNHFSFLKFQRINNQPKRDLGVFGYNRGKLFVSIKKDFTSFIVNSLIISVFIYSVCTLAPKETISQRRKRIIRERLMKEYGLTEEDLERVEEFDDVVEK